MCCVPFTCRYIPDEAYLSALISHIHRQLSDADGDALSMVLWAVATMRRPPPGGDDDDHDAVDDNDNHDIKTEQGFMAAWYSQV